MNILFYSSESCSCSSQISYPAESCSAGDKVCSFSLVLHVDEKLAFKKYWKGPYKVVKKINPVIFRVKGMNDASDIQDIYIKRLKKAHLSRRSDSHNTR